MFPLPWPGRPRALHLVAAEAALAVLLVIAGGWVDRQGRSVGPEATLVAYAAAVAREDLAGALDQLAPEPRARAASFVAWQLGNRYTILESAVRADSTLSRLAGAPPSRPRVVATLEVQSEGLPTWRTTEELPVEPIDGRWYLLRAPLESEE